MGIFLIYYNIIFLDEGSLVPPNITVVPQYDDELYLDEIMVSLNLSVSMKLMSWCSPSNTSSVLFEIAHSLESACCELLSCKVWA